MSDQAAAPMYNVLRVEGFDPDALAELITDTRIEQRILRGGPFSVTHHRVNWGDVILECGEYSLPVLAQGCLPRDRLCIGFTLDAREIGSLNGEPVLPGSPLGGRARCHLNPQGRSASSCSSPMSWRSPTACNWTIVAFPVPRCGELRSSAALVITCSPISIGHSACRRSARSPRAASACCSSFSAARRWKREITAGKVKVDGDAAKLGELVALLDKFGFWFNIVTP